MAALTEAHLFTDAENTGSTTDGLETECARNATRYNAGSNANLNANKQTRFENESEEPTLN